MERKSERSAMSRTGRCAGDERAVKCLQEKCVAREKRKEEQRNRKISSQQKKMCVEEIDLKSKKGRREIRPQEEM